MYHGDRESDSTNMHAERRLYCTTEREKWVLRKQTAELGETRQWKTGTANWAAVDTDIVAQTTGSST